MTAFIDRIDTGRVQRTADGYSAEVIAVVSDVPGDEWTRRFEALRTPGLPAYGSVHPAEPSIFLLDTSAEPAGAGSTRTFIVRLGYRPARADDAVPSGDPLGPTTWSGDVTTYSEQTYQDVNGNSMLVGYRGRPTQLVIDATTGQVDETIPFVFGVTSILNIIELATANVDRPTQIMRATRWERDNPERAAESVTGSTNRARFRGKAPRTVLCRGVRFEPAANGGFQVSYEFAYRPAGWQVRATVSYQGKVPDDATVGNGIQFYDVLPAADFASLRL